MTTSNAVSAEFARLETILRDLLVLAGRLKDILEEKRALLLESRLDRLPPLIASEEKALARLEERERDRYALTTFIAVKLGLDDDATLSEILAGADAATGHPLASLGKKLAAKMSEVREVNFSNAVLARNLAIYSEQILRMVTITTEHPNYGAEGGFEYEGLRRNLVDRKA
ncbi:MAG: flagellar protein FlgN [bacterium]